ncbi:MAG TPA: hypothetical protein VFV73_15110 [Streptosporangiaceae bacterium]|nr:hypothetical protein [Streptosporangiaceae bacterium]
MDVGDIDPEDFQLEWRQARREWGQVNQRKLEAQASGVPLSEAEQAAWLQAKSRFEDCERLWDQMYKAGVVVVVGGDDEEDDLA